MTATLRSSHRSSPRSPAADTPVIKHGSMGKGLSQRHRIKQAKKANEGNLRKAVSPHSALVHLPHQPAALWARMPLLSSVIDCRPCLPCLTGTCMIAMQQLGKGGATPYLPLPQAPKSEEFIDRVPRSLQKLMALKVRVPGRGYHGCPKGS